MQDTTYGCRGGLAQERHRIGFGVTRVQNDRPFEFRRQCELRVENAQLLRARCVIVMVVETTLTHGNSTSGNGLPNGYGIALVVPLIGVMRMYTARMMYEARIPRCNRLCAQRGRWRLPDTHEQFGSRGTGTCDNGVRIICERRIGQMHMTIGECCRLRHVVSC